MAINSFTSGEYSAVSKVKCHLGGRIALVGSSLLSLAEAVGRAILCCMAFIGYLITLGCWQQAKNFASDQMQKGGHAASISLSLLRSITSPKELANYLPKARTAGRHLIEPQESPIPQRPSLPSLFRKVCLAGQSFSRGLVVPGAGQQAEGFDLERKVKRGAGLIADKLQRQFQYAQDQADQEFDKAFRYLAAPESFQGDAHSKNVAGYEVGVCHFIGQRPTMEDEHLATSFNLVAGGKSYPVQVFGIFDGHGSGAASRYVKENLELKLHETLNQFCAGGLTDEAIWNALKITFVKLNEEFNEGQSGTTATVAMILDGKLWTANVGDSRTILDNNIQLSEDAKPTDRRYRNGIEKRGGEVYRNRINGILAVARAVGDRDVGAVSARPKITAYPLAWIPRGSHLILACDGIYDVSSTRQVAFAVQTHKGQTAAELAKNIVYSAYHANSGDNLSALVVKF